MERVGGGEGGTAFKKLGILVAVRGSSLDYLLRSARNVRDYNFKNSRAQFRREVYLTCVVSNKTSNDDD